MFGERVGTVSLGEGDGRGDVGADALVVEAIGGVDVRGHGQARAEGCQAVGGKGVREVFDDVRGALVEDGFGARGDCGVALVHNGAGEVDGYADDLGGSDGDAERHMSAHVEAVGGGAAAAGRGARGGAHHGAVVLERAQGGGHGGHAQAKLRGDVLLRQGRVCVELAQYTQLGGARRRSGGGFRR